MRHGLSPRELASCGLFGAAALLLPPLFHVLRLGPLFMPMYLPLVALAFFVRPVPAMATALLAPLLSAILTGMPPLYPPIAPVMALELSAMCGAIALVGRRWPKLPSIALLAVALLGGRVLFVVLVYLLALLVELPAVFVTGIGLTSGWPGVILMLVVIPPLVAFGRRRHDDGDSDAR